MVVVDLRPFGRAWDEHLDFDRSGLADARIEVVGVGESDVGGDSLVRRQDQILGAAADVGTSSFTDLAVCGVLQRQRWIAAHGAGSTCGVREAQLNVLGSGRMIGIPEGHVELGAGCCRGGGVGRQWLEGPRRKVRPRPALHRIHVRARRHQQRSSTEDKSLHAASLVASGRYVATEAPPTMDS